MDNCKFCHRPMTDEVLKKKREMKSANVKASQAKAKAKGIHIGRPKIRDDKAIAKLRKLGLSLRAIAKELNISTWSVQTSLKIKDKK